MLDLLWRFARFSARVTIVISIGRGAPFFWPVALLGTLCAFAAAVSVFAAPLPEEHFSFTAEQVAHGSSIYAAECASCHGGKLEGGAGPALSSGAFLQYWSNGQHKMAELYQAVASMPKQAPYSLAAVDYHNLLAFLLSSNGYPSGDSASAEAALDSIIIAPTGKAASVPSAHVNRDLPASQAVAEAATANWPTAQELTNPRDQDWPMYNRDYQGQRFSALTRIDRSNAGRLQPICVLQLGVLGAFQASPIIYKGTGYVSTNYTLQSFDAATCKSKWVYTYAPQGRENIPTNRGVALFDGRLFRGTTDAHLLAVDAASGKLLWDTQVADSAVGYWISAAPIAVNGMVIVGLAGGDYGANGHIYAFDAKSGKSVWRFDTIATSSQPGSSSWSAGGEHGGGATWTTVSVDPAAGLVYVPVGNPSPDFNPSFRVGANLYSNCVVALDIQTGKISWYVQQVANDYHDYDTAAAPVLYAQDGHAYMAVGSKDGYVYIYDRESHALLAKVSVTTIKNADAAPSATPTEVCPGTTGGVEWNGPAYDSNSRALYVNAEDWCGRYATEQQPYVSGTYYQGGSYQFTPASAARGWLTALDAVSGRIIWRYQAPTLMLAGVTPTAGGVIFTGQADGEFLVFDARNGHLLYHFNTGGGVAGGVSTYEVGGRQYVAVTSGNHGMFPAGASGAPTIFVFGLPTTSVSTH